MSQNLPHLASRLLNTPLLLSRAKLDALLSVLGPRLDLSIPTTEGAAYAGTAPRRDYQILDGGVAIIPIYGTLVHRSSYISAASGLMTYQAIQDWISDALSSPAVSQILLEVDSPGGEVHGVFDLAEMIYKSRGKKPITAAINEQAFSAAYLLASAADRVVIPRTGGAGSIGVIAAHVDWSKANEMEGLKVTTVFAGDRKNDFNPDEPLTDEALQILRTHIDETYGLFVDTVARNLGLSTQAVRDTKAGLFYGKAAVTAKLAHKVQSFNDTLTELVQQATKKGASTMSAEAPKPTVHTNAPATPTPRAEASTEGQDAHGWDKAFAKAAKPEANAKGEQGNGNNGWDAALKAARERVV